VRFQPSSELLGYFQVSLREKPGFDHHLGGENVQTPGAPPVRYRLRAGGL